MAEGQPLHVILERHAVYASASDSYTSYFPFKTNGTNPTAAGPFLSGPWRVWVPGGGPVVNYSAEAVVAVPASGKLDVAVVSAAPTYTTESVLSVYSL